MDQNLKPTLPNFLIVGAARSGTTSLYYYLRQHPEVYMSRIKEPNFILSQFIDISKREASDSARTVVKNFNEYSRLFNVSEQYKAVGEASTDNLFYYEKSIKYIKHYLGNPKIIIILRNPVERAFSAYMLLVRDNNEHLSFQEALDREERKMIETGEYTSLHKNAGLYYKQVKAYIDNFRDVKVCLFDDLLNSPLLLMKDIYSFLSVDTSFIPDVKTGYNASGIPKYNVINDFFIKSSKVHTLIKMAGKFILKDDRWSRLRDTVRSKLIVRTEMDAETGQYLKNFYFEDIMKLQGLLGRNLSSWLQSSK